MRKTLKILHTVGSCGMVGALVAALVLIAFAPQASVAAYADMRQSIAHLSSYILLPSLGIVIVSGLLAMAAHAPYCDKGWALVKAGFGVIVFKGGLHIVSGHEEAATHAADAAAQGLSMAEAMANGALAHEGLMLWTMLIIAIANIVLGVWRPRFSARKTSTTAFAVRPAKPTEAEPTPAPAPRIAAE